MNNDNRVCQAGRINFCGEPQIQMNNAALQESSYEKAFYAIDDQANEYCLNTAAWD